MEYFICLIIGVIIGFMLGSNWPNIEAWIGSITQQKKTPVPYNPLGYTHTSKEEEEWPITYSGVANKPKVSSFTF